MHKYATLINTRNIIYLSFQYLRNHRILQHINYSFLYLKHPLANIVFTCKHCEILSIKYLCVSLGTVKRIQKAVFHAVYNFETHWELKFEQGGFKNGALLL